jgi:transcriptional regulator with XRE-family HTH domain
MKGEELGKILEVSKAQVSSIELGRSKLNTDQLAIVCELFGVSSSYIMGDHIKEVSMVEQLSKKVEQLEAVVDYFRGRDGSMGKLHSAQKTVGRSPFFMSGGILSAYYSSNVPSL